MIHDSEYLAPKRVPRGWHFFGFNENGIGQFSMIGHVVGIVKTDFSIATDRDASLHIVIADRPLPDYYSVFNPTDTGGLESQTKGAKRVGAAVRQLHLTDSDHHRQALERLWKTRQECRIEGVFFDMTCGDDLYEFQGFHVGCQCPTARIDKIVKIESTPTAIGDFLRSMKSVAREFVGLN